jgi:hypothetical protein
METLLGVPPHERSELDADIAGLNLEPVTYLAVREGWTLEKADTLELEYRCFLQCIRDYPDVVIVPTRDCDLYWHQHILALPLYLEHCDQLFGHTLMHWPFTAMDEEDAALHQHRFRRSLKLVKGLVERVLQKRAMEQRAA